MHVSVLLLYVGHTVHVDSKCGVLPEVRRYHDSGLHHLCNRGIHTSQPHITMSHSFHVSNHSKGQSVYVVYEFPLLDTQTIDIHIDTTLFTAQ